MQGERKRKGEGEEGLAEEGEGTSPHTPGIILHLNSMLRQIKDVGNLG